MDDRRFDALTRSFAAGASRRRVVKGMLGGLVGGIALGGARKTFAQDDATPVDPSAPPATVCDVAIGQLACGDACCDAGWRCCGVYCIPGDEDACCGDADCGTCGACGQDSYCYPVCEAQGLACCADEKSGTFTCAECCKDDPSCEVQVDCNFCESQGLECCVDDKHTVTCAQCCDASDCYEGWGPCATCYGGYCLSCFDQTDGNAPICAPLECAASVAAGDDSANYCVQCCEDYQCGPCEICHNGWCEFVCDKDEQCCTAVAVAAADLINGGYCAHCCGREDCGDCEQCYEGHCEYQCEKGEICCHGEYCSTEKDGCCGVQGDWCEPLAAADNLNGSCCDGFNCCWDDKTKTGSCAECCGEWDCDEGWYCCGGVCQPECCDDKDCDWGVCVDGYCKECGVDDDCGKGEICCSGECVGNYECCFENGDDPDHCGDCETCLEGWCRPTGVELYGACNPVYIVGVADDSSPQLNCCDGLVCCESSKWGLVCLECCADVDCAEGCFCDDGFCSCPCGSDKDCADGTCCCKNGSCSADCCPAPEPKPETPVTTLPATGSGDTAKSSGLLGAAAIGAAALFAASRLRETPETSTED